MFSANTSQVSDDKLFVEDVFSTYLYTGNDSTQTIANGIDLAGKGGLVWIKQRSGSTSSHVLVDTARGTSKLIYSNETTAQFNASPNDVSAFNSNGFSLNGTWSYAKPTNAPGQTYASWTFREAPKFFDIVTYTGNGVYNRQIAHNLGIAPGAIFIKRTDSASNWGVGIRVSSPAGEGKVVASAAGNFNLNTTGGTTQNTTWDGYAVSSTTFNVSVIGGGIEDYNVNGATYVAYLFAHDTTSDGIIQCGSFTTDGSETSVNLGWEPQWVMFKRSSGTGAWLMNDNMRGWPVDGSSSFLEANTSGAEFSQSSRCHPTNIGFKVNNQLLGDYIYIAIRRGPMRTPTSGTSVFSPALQASSTTPQTKNYGFVTDALISMIRDQTGYNNAFWDRLRGANTRLSSNSTNAESSANTDAVIGFDSNVGVRLGADGGQWVQNGGNWVHWAFRRAPSFFDEVCWTNTGATQNVSHNLGVVPELIITKRRAASENWQIYSAPTGASAYLNFTNLAVVTGNTNRWNATSPTSTAFTTGAAFNTTENYVAYLFASCPGVSKVGSYTGNGSSQTINCGFAAGARFVMIKRTDNAGSWFVWDTARGITSGNDPYLRLDSAGAEAGASYNSIDPDSSGFVVVQSDAAQININGATYIYLAVA